ncbi:galactose-3-O-sulfotransferase 2-like [Branchiostoma floridae]|uniref:Galactose-3-O-sulfotransferase 2-like n=1 Tax=Branchiostoma floridae TaxID=7739 RepID=A0A9J7KGQ2_BRAFL|nr:galactose-3-O-sulfotransferase 2-like [Branchiostoma floridae]
MADIILFFLSRVSIGPCSAKVKHVVFLKVHKAASTTVASIFQRFGWKHNLTFVLPTHYRDYIGWPYYMKPQDILPSPTGSYNILCDHVVYDDRILSTLMPDDTFSIAILREPLSHLKSVFHWWHLDQKYNVSSHTGSDVITSFLDNPMFYETRLSSNVETLRPFIYTRNFQSYDFGFPVHLSDHENFVQEFLEAVKTQFHLVMIMEYFDESLVLLKRLLCWELVDILYLGLQRSRTYSYKTTKVSRETVDKHQQWSKVDYNMYDYFNKSLWKMIQNEEQRSFYSEVRHFENVLLEVQQYCSVLPKGYMQSLKPVPKKIIPASEWNDVINLDELFCLELRMGWDDWEYVIKSSHLGELRRQSSFKFDISFVQVPRPTSVMSRILRKRFQVKGPKLVCENRSTYCTLDKRALNKV